MERMGGGGQLLGGGGGGGFLAKSETIYRLCQTKGYAQNEVNYCTRSRSVP